uniref:adenosine deaminase-like protein isoform X1 n=1 Tax=Myxine glutinosa TaxID=7769 RepID=UPI00358FE9BF
MQKIGQNGEDCHGARKTHPCSSRENGLKMPVVVVLCTVSHVLATVVLLLGMTRRSYVEAVLNAIRSPEISALDITVRLLLSIDRKNGAMVAMETVKLAQEYLLTSDDCVVGVDLSGNPKVGHWRDFYPALQVARNTGLKLSLHLAEIPGQDEETQALLELRPHRIGHGTFLKASRNGTSELVEHVRKLKIPLELCLTSNVKCQTVKTYHEHHFKFWFDQSHPCTFCTDDKGVFSTTLSEEYGIAATTFGLSPKQLWDISYNSIDFAFAQHDVKDKLRFTWNEHKHLILRK